MGAWERASARLMMLTFFSERMMSARTSVQLAFDERSREIT